MRRPRTYQQAGVDIALAKSFIQGIQPLAEFTRRPGLLRGIGGFGGLFELDPSKDKKRILVASADGVGTKLRLARLLQWVEPLGVDLVAMNVNDILCTGAEPLFFLDYIACGKLDPKTLMGIVRGIVRGCLESQCVFLGGETAQMPLIYRSNEFDLAGFAVGMVERSHLITGQKIKPGDQVLGLASNGLHANGFTLVQKVFSPTQLKRLGPELLKATRIYVRPVLGALRKGAPIHGIAHITGGAFPEKIPRILPKGLSVCLCKESWKVPSIFRRIQATGVPETEMYRTFNMGIGMVLILPDASVPRLKRALQRQGLASYQIGEVIRGRHEVNLE